MREKNTRQGENFSSHFFPAGCSKIKKREIERVVVVGHGCVCVVIAERQKFSTVFLLNENVSWRIFSPPTILRLVGAYFLHLLFCLLGI